MTLDSATRARLKLIYPEVAVRITRVYEDMWNRHRLAMRASETLRTYAWQAALYAKGRTAPGEIVTYSKPGDSRHHFGCAVDSVFVGKDPYLERRKDGAVIWQDYGRFCRAHGLEWGGDWSKFVDRPHAQLMYGLSLQSLQALYKQGGLACVYRKFDSIRGVQEGSEWNGVTTRYRLLEAGLNAEPSAAPV